jgi:hypothetical protein
MAKSPFWIMQVSDPFRSQYQSELLADDGYKLFLLFEMKMSGSESKSSAITLNVKCS